MTFKEYEYLKEQFMEQNDKTIWVKILNFIVEVIKIIIAIFFGISATNLIG